MKSVLVIGLGRFGKHIIEKLNELHCQVMAVDRNETRILRQKRNTMIQCNYKAIMLWLRPKRAQ